MDAHLIYSTQHNSMHREAPILATGISDTLLMFGNFILHRVLSEKKRIQDKCCVAFKILEDPEWIKLYFL